jgi:hypothetical protein
VRPPQCREDVWQAVERQDIGSSSFKFIAHEDTWDFADGMPMRTLVSGKLLDVAAVTIPAYNNTSVNVRSIYSSLARYADAPVEDVERYWRNGEVRKFFRTTASGVHSSSAGRRPMTVREKNRERRRQLQLLAYRWGTPITPQQAQVEQLRLKSRFERMAELEAMREPPQRRSGRQALLETLAMRKD